MKVEDIFIKRSSRVCLWGICMVWLMWCNMAFAQDFHPGQQVQGVLDSKDIMVDYATGTFHYKIPLHTLKMGSFELPISLDYTGKGVKALDASGVIGYNWTLNMGGVVTRVVRGGIADDEYPIGSLWRNSSSVEGGIAAVSTHNSDGEADIFTVVFNGRSIDFVIRYNERKVQVLPLEKTYVRIEPKMNKYTIVGWIITDENGNRYIYEQVGWTTNLYKEDAISLNGLHEKQYISSWFPSRIEPLNGEPIVYKYKADVSPMEVEKQNEIQEFTTNMSYYAYYTYGKPMKDRPMNFSKYRQEFTQALNEAQFYMQEDALANQVESAIYPFQNAGDWIFSPTFDAPSKVYELNGRVLGIIANLRNVSQASQELVDALDNLKNYYIMKELHATGIQASNAEMAAGYVNIAKRCVIRCLEEVNDVNTKEIINVTQYKVRIPVLAKISCLDQYVNLSYQTTLGDGAIQLKNISTNQSHFLLEQDNSGLLARIGIVYGNHAPGSYEFDYYLPYASDGITYSGRDNWGYYCKTVKLEDRYREHVDKIALKSYSLKSISLIDGGKISLDYESNYPKGGLRLKSVLASDSLTNQSQMITYEYPLPGINIYENVSKETLNYSNFSDQVKYSMVQFRGHAFSKTGNNGIYYRYVIERMQGKGAKAYLFHVPDNRGLNSSNPYPYWLYGLPLSIASYDEDGNLKQLKKNKYYIYNQDTTSCCLYDNVSYFTFSAVCMPAGILTQTQPYEYYLDRNKLSQYYKAQGTQVLYKEYNTPYSISPYYEVYIPNIEPRTYITVPNCQYSLFYGVTTLPKEDITYSFEGRVTDKISIADFNIEAEAVAFQKQEYLYDNINSVYPTRLIQTDVYGKKKTTVIKRVNEMDEKENGFITIMKKKNVIAPVIKQQLFRGQKLQEEQIFCYQADTCGIVISEQYIYVPDNDTITSIDIPANDTIVCLESDSIPNWAIPDGIIISPKKYCQDTLFTFEKGDYSLLNAYEYETKNHSFLPVKHIRRDGFDSVVYDEQNRIVMKLKGASSSSVGISDMSYQEDEINRKDPEWIEPACCLYADIYKFLSIMDTLNMAKIPRMVRTYYQGEDYMNFKKFFSCMTYFYDSQHLEEAISCLIPISANKFSIVDKFINMNKYAANYVDIPFNYIEDFFHNISSGLLDSREFLTFYFGGGMPERYDVFSTLDITPLPDCKGVNIFVFTKNEQVPVHYMVHHSGGVTDGFFKTQKIGKEHNLQIFSLDLTTFMDVVSVEIIHHKKNAWIVASPEEVEFEAFSYMKDGNIYAKFDQTGNLERYIYKTGQITDIKDRYGNLQTTFLYNSFNNSNKK